MRFNELILLLHVRGTWVPTGLGVYPETISENIGRSGNSVISGYSRVIVHVVLFCSVLLHIVFLGSVHSLVLRDLSSPGR